MHDGSTKYLSELKPGDVVAISDPSGKMRGLTVGRLKIEPRPMLCVKFQIDGRHGQVFLQQAETVRLMVEDPHDGWVPKSVTNLAAGDVIRTRWRSQGTHVGRAISAAVNE